MKKIILITVLVIVSLGLLYIGFNQLDAAPATSTIEGVDMSSLEKLANSLFDPPSFDKSNGFYRLYSLSEPVDVDIESDEVILKYRQLHDPQFDNSKYIKLWEKSKESWKANKEGRGNYREFHSKRQNILGKGDSWDNFPKNPSQDWCQLITANRESLLQLKDLFQVHLKRYEKMIHSELFEDFTFIRLDAPLPNLLAWLHLAKLYTTQNMLDALDGNWEPAIDNLLAQIQMTKKGIKTSRTIIVNLVAKAVMRMSLRGLVSLMNQPGFPPHLYKKIIQGLPPIHFDEFGCRKPLLVETYNLGQIKEGGLLLQKNRTQQYFFNFMARLVKSEEIPPYQWESHPTKNDVSSNWSWWLQNPEGKILFEKTLESKTMENLFTVIFKGYWVRCDYEMTRISAELHDTLYTNPQQSIQETLNSLHTYQTWTDPCSGKPYTWNEKKQLLYSFGTDRDDDGGRVDMNNLDTDFALPLVSFIK